MRKLLNIPVAGSWKAPATQGGTGAAAMGIAAALLLCLLPVPATYARDGWPHLADAAPTVSEIGQFVQMVFWGVGCIGALLGVAVAIKQLRHRPTAPRDVPQPLYIKLAEEFATKLELERLDLESRGRAAVNRERIEKLEGLLDGRHRENVASITALGAKIDKAREDVRHDVREEVQPIQSKIDSHNSDVAEKFQELAREIGGLKSAKDTNDALSAEVRQTLNILLSRTAPAARRGGGSME